jgi:hypothetical protein
MLVFVGGCSKRPFSKAAASEEARRTLRYVEPLSDARTMLADFFSILLKSLELPVALSQRFGQLPRIPALLRTSLRQEILPCIQFFVERYTDRARRPLQFPDKFLGLHDKGPLRCRNVDNLTIRTHHSASGPEFSSQPLNHLIGLFSPSREDNFKTKPMLPLFRAPSLLPPVKDHRDRMGFSLTIRRQIAKERLARHLGMQACPCTDPTRQRQEIVPIDNKVKCHD